ncbi:putative cell wall-binding protein [Microbacteriaceae bacterium SG_E_30_P1]|uniref:Cell wall-binding protein n=1 Tax=Antiquaquibacter oligotrophicus TaxID=2880260 RepID=A0ABT6KQS9_9MICO|nr:cell wall-binding repeat-containing protein [Antiquaquibacter oligotrophicus]MDH6182340.1 putative cell wall-binding protein [Antiquaquibacter oligotrophicus]UDF12007.1 cell wall-binding repeat-containing protein [Antiquaquibacter oligotrophicus]
MKLGSQRVALLTAAAVVATTAMVAAPAYADTTTIYAAPGGSGEACTVSAPCSIEGAQEFVRDFQEAPTGDITVELADGRYEIAEPLEFRAEDGGRDGSTVRWTAASGANPVISGASPVTGWTLHDAEKNIYVADTPVGLDSRNLYVNGVTAQKATYAITNNAHITITETGVQLNDPSLAFLNNLPDQDRIEFESKGDFTNRFSPVVSISGNVATMKQPAWNNNTWGWDTVQYSLLAPSHYWFNNAYEFINEVGEWYLQPDDGKLYYKPAADVDPNNLDIQLPRIELIASVGGTYDEPVQNLEFSGITFTGSSWLEPTSEGYATQQNGSYIKGVYEYRPADAFTSCRRGCELFERARTGWYQQPAAVQVSAAQGVVFDSNTFVNLGSAALGVGNDTNAAYSGVGLGASDITVNGNLFNEVSGQGIFVGGNRPDAHHPSDVRMTNKDIYITNNTVNRVAVDFKDNSGILSTYVTNAQIVNNEVSNVSYDGIDTGYGWGMNDEGGSGEYTNRGYYNWNTRYTTPTTLKDNRVAANIVHHAKGRFSDGGSIYNLSATPGSFIERNYVYNNPGVGLYADEGTRYATYRQNVLQNNSPWYFNNSYGATNTSNNTITGNWYNQGGVSIPNQGSNSITLTGNVQVSGTNWPAGAQQVICEAGVAGEYRTHFNANLFTENSACGGQGGPVQAPYQTSGVSATSSFFAQDGDSFGIRAAGADVWGAGGQTDDDFGAIFKADSVGANSFVSARVDSLNDTNAWAKSGVMIRNDITQPDTSPGYAILAVTRSNGVVFQWDSNGDGRVDQASSASADLYRAIWLKIQRANGQYTAHYSYDGVNYAQIGAAVTLPGAAAVQDGGIFSTSHHVSQSAINVFSDLTIADAVDETAPTVSASVSGRTVTLDAEDAGSGVASIEYQLPGGEWTAYTEPFVVPGTDTVTVSYRATDNDGNVSEVATIDVIPAPDAEVDRIAGANRYEVAVNISQAAYPDTAPVVYIANGQNYPDALSAGPAAAFEGGPLLLVQPDVVPDSVKAEIERLNPSKIVVVGGILSVTEGSFNELAALTDETVRVAGANRYEVSRNLAEYAFDDEVPFVYIATGEKFPDALAAGGAAGTRNAPVVLVPGSAATLDAATSALLTELGTTDTRVLGGEASVTAGVFAGVDALTTAVRLGGADRYQAARTINADAFDSAEHALIATGMNFPDALAGSAWAAAAGAPLFVAPGSCIPSGVLADLADLGVTHLTLLGGEMSLTPEVASLTPCA